MILPPIWGLILVFGFEISNLHFSSLQRPESIYCNAYRCLNFETYVMKANWSDLHSVSYSLPNNTIDR